MGKYVDISPKLYVGVRNETGFNTIEYPLSFVTWFEKDDSAYKNRKKTVDSWCKFSTYDDATKKNTWLDGVQYLIDNTPVEGFHIAGFASRYSTQNKWFNINDPRGFSIQISADSLINLLNCTSILKGGKIEGKCVWGRGAGSNILVPIDSSDYQAFTMLNSPKPNKNNQPKYGDMVVIGKERLIYLGEAAAAKVRVDYENNIQPINGLNGFNYNWIATTYGPKTNVTARQSIHMSTKTKNVDDEIKASLYYQRKIIKTFHDIVYLFLTTPEKETDKQYLIVYLKKQKIKGIIGPYVPKPGEEPLKPIGEYLTHEYSSDMLRNYDFENDFAVNYWSRSGYVFFKDSADMHMNFSDKTIDTFRYPKSVIPKTITNLQFNTQHLLWPSLPHTNISVDVEFEAVY